MLGSQNGPLTLFILFNYMFYLFYCFIIYSVTILYIYFRCPPGVHGSRCENTTPLPGSPGNININTTKIKSRNYFDLPLFPVR